MTLAGKNADNDIRVPTERVGHGLRNFLPMAPGQLAVGRGPADLQHTRDSSRAEIRAVTIIRHVELAQMQA